MSVTQLAIRFNSRQIETLDLLAEELHTTRSAVIKKLVDDAERTRVRALYAAAYPKEERTVDHYGDLDAFHEEAEAERIAARSADVSW